MNFEKRTQNYLAFLGLALAIILVAVSLGKTNWMNWAGMVAAISLGVVILSETAFFSYLKKSQYKSVGIGDIVVIVGAFIGALLIIQGLLLFNVINQSAPEWLTTFLSVHGVSVSVVALLLFVYHWRMPRPQ